MPTPSTADLYDQYLLGNYAWAPVAFVRGQGSRIWDEEGKCYLDFAGGIAVNAIGHCHPKWVKRLQDQLATLSHCSNLFKHHGQGMLAKRLSEKTGTQGRVFFCNTGTEANEGLLKLARLHGATKAGKEGVCYKVLCAEKAFHGRTFGSMAATPQEKIQGGFRPMLDGFAFGKLNDADSFAKLIDDSTAAIFVETIQGEGGVHACTTAFLQALRTLCDQHNLLLILDEVQCGIGRTGKFFAYQHHDVQPDAIGMAKGIGGGFPMGAIWIAEKYASLFKPGSHGTTFAGSPLACAAGLAMLDIMEEEQLLAHVNATAPLLLSKLQDVVRKYPQHCAEVRGHGFMLAIGMTADPGNCVTALRNNGLIVVRAGDNAIRFLPALNATADEISEAVGILDHTLASL